MVQKFNVYFYITIYKYERECMRAVDCCGNKMKLLGVKNTFKKSVKRETFSRRILYFENVQQ